MKTTETFNRAPTAAELEADRIGFARNLADDGTTPTTDPCTPTGDPPPITFPAPLADLRHQGLRPFVVWSYAYAAYLDVPTIWAQNEADALRKWVYHLDPRAELRDRYGRRASRRTRDVAVRWSRLDILVLGLLRVDALPLPTTEPVEACACIAHTAPVTPAAAAAPPPLTVDDWLALYTAAKRYGDEARAALCRDHAQALTLRAEAGVP